MFKPLNYITPQGLKSIQDELHDLLHKQRPEIVKAVSVAAAMGDRSENADYIYGKRRMREIDRRIHFLQKRLDNIDVVDPKTVVSDKVSFGATVTIEDANAKELTYQIVGADEIEASQGKVSWKSPLAKSLMGHKVGDEIIVKRPKGEAEFLIVKIEYI